MAFRNPLKSLLIQGSQLATNAIDGMTIHDPAITFKGHALPYTVGGSTVATPNASGQITITYGVTFASAPQITACNGDAAAALNILVAVDQSVRSTVQARVRLFDAATGAPVTTQNRRVNWVACGTITA